MGRTPQLNSPLATPVETASKVRRENQQSERTSLLAKASDALTIETSVMQQHASMGGAVAINSTRRPHPAAAAFRARHWS